MQPPGAREGISRSWAPALQPGAPWQVNLSWAEESWARGNFVSPGSPVSFVIPEIHLARKERGKKNVTTRSSWPPFGAARPGLINADGRFRNLHKVSRASHPRKLYSRAPGTCWNFSRSRQDPPTVSYALLLLPFILRPPRALSSPRRSNPLLRSSSFIPSPVAAAPLFSEPWTLTLRSFFSFLDPLASTARTWVTMVSRFAVQAPRYGSTSNKQLRAVLLSFRVDKLRSSSMENRSRSENAARAGVSTDGPPRFIDFRSIFEAISDRSGIGYRR